MLLADHQTTGGYPKIATVVSADLDRLVQLRSGGKVRFEQIGPETAVEVARNARVRLDNALAAAVLRNGNFAERLYGADLVGGVVNAAD